MIEQIKKTCKWYFVENSPTFGFKTSCGRWFDIDGGDDLSFYGFNFCPFCGGELQEVNNVE